MKKLILLAITTCLFAGPIMEADAGPRRWSRKKKGAAIGAASGAVIGGVAKGKKGAVVGAAAGASSGYLLGRRADRKRGRVSR